MDGVANCLHDLTALGTGGTLALAGALFLAGLVGSATHCVGMCGPFVAAQVTARFSACPTLSRLEAGALVPYHLGRMLTYTGLGAVAGFLSGTIVHAAGFRPMLVALLLLGALLMLAQAMVQVAALLPSAPAGIADRVVRLASPLLADPRGSRRFLLGVVLGFLPCGLLYGALAAAASSASALGGAIAMAAFALGTVPALLGVGLAGAFFGRRFRPVARAVAAPLLLLNAAVLGALALRAAGYA
ncbi:sulfite exporter TauE/SafE family protein [Elioraea thermophila]|uniref:sulfite exporter TauE/SafE family protein n=1 Tax=Elioraea thermophila TaxID=2185104 RepID=UPI000DF39700|nr:sulfite exporter TauE/SafE family protein [Elioraea thermophila]